jgi:hypothetical protein
VVVGEVVGRLCEVRGKGGGEGRGGEGRVEEVGKEVCNLKW